MSRPLTQAALDGFRCDDPMCDSNHTMVSLTARCHPEAGFAVSYCKMHGVILCLCNECEDVVATIAVAASTGGAMTCRHQ